MASPVSLSFATLKMALGYDTHYFALKGTLLSQGNNFIIAVRDDYHQLRTEHRPPSPDAGRFFLDLCKHIRGSAIVAIWNPVVERVLHSDKFLGDRVVLSNGVVVPIFQSAEAQDIPVDSQGAIFLRKENVVVLWTKWIGHLKSMYDAVDHELQHIISVCPCTVERPPFSLADGPFSSSSSRATSLPPAHTRAGPLSLPLSDLDHLDHLNDLAPLSNLGPLAVGDAWPKTYVRSLHEELDFYQPGLTDFDAAYNTHSKEGRSLLQMPASSPISSASGDSPPSSCYSPQTVFDAVSPALTGGTPGSPFDSDVTSPSSMASEPYVQEEFTDNSNYDSEEDNSDAETERQRASALSAAHFTFPMPPPIRSHPTGGKTRVFAPSNGDWHSVSTLQSSKYRKKSSTVLASPAESIHRLAPSGTTPSGAFASMHISSPSQPPAGSSFLAPARIPTGSTLTSRRLPGASTSPRRSALSAREVVSPATDEEPIVYVAYMDDVDEEDDYPVAGQSAILSPRPSSTKTGTKRKKRRTGGAVSQKKQKFACEDCAQTFTREADMRRHRNTACKKASVVESIPCQYCQVPFNRGDALNRHIRTKHRNIVAAP